MAEQEISAAFPFESKYVTVHITSHPEPFASLRINSAKGLSGIRTIVFAWVGDSDSTRLASIESRASDPEREQFRDRFFARLRRGSE